MVCLNSTLINFSEKDSFFSAFENYNNDFEYTTKGVLRRIKPPKCPNCDTWMNHNGYNTYAKKNLGSVKIGRYVCPICGELDEENREFWEDMKTELFSALNPIYQLLRVHHVSYEGISQVMDHIFPRGKTPYSVRSQILWKKLLFRLLKVVILFIMMNSSLNVVVHRNTASHSWIISQLNPLLMNFR